MTVVVVLSAGGSQDFEDSSAIDASYNDAVLQVGTRNSHATLAFEEFVPLHAFAPGVWTAAHVEETPAG